MIDWKGHHYLEELKVKAERVEYNRWLSQRGDHFTGQLYALIWKADPMNKQRLAQVFPLEVFVVAEHQEDPILRRFTVVPAPQDKIKMSGYDY